MYGYANFSEDVNIDGSLNVTGNANFNKDVNIDGNLNVDLNANFNQNVNIDLSLNVYGYANFSEDVNIDGNLNVDLDADFNQNVNIDGSLNVYGYADFNQNVNIDGSLNVTNLNVFNITIDGSFNIPSGGDATFENDIIVNLLTVGRGSGDVSNNTVLGYQALIQNTGDGNTAIGYQVLTQNTSGYFNTATGVKALTANNNGIGNTAFGLGTLINNTNGAQNTAIGIAAGENNVDGSNNTFVGAQTDVDSSLNSYTKSTALGYGAIIDASNQIVFGTSTEKIKIPGSYIGINGIYNPDGSYNYNVDLSGNLQILHEINNIDTSVNQSALRIVSFDSTNSSSTYDVINSSITTVSQGYEMGYFGIRDINKGGSNGFMGLYPGNYASGDYNGISQTGDNMIIFGNYPYLDTSAGFVICPWSKGAASGLRMDSSGSILIRGGEFPLSMNSSVHDPSYSLTFGLDVSAGDYSEKTRYGDNIIWWSDNDGSYNLNSGLILAPHYGNSAAGIRISNTGLSVNTEWYTTDTDNYALYVSGDTNITGSLTVDGSINFNYVQMGDVDISGNVQIDGSLNVYGCSYIVGRSYINSGPDINYGPTPNHFPLSLKGPSAQGADVLSSLNFGFNMGAGSYNEMTDNGDNIIWWSDTSAGLGYENNTSGLVIAPWNSYSPTPIGIRISNDGLSVNTGNGSQSLTAGYALYVDGSANITGNHYAATYNSSSDYRIKENITSLDETFIVDNLRPVTYTNTKTEKQDVGFIAHELQEQYPFLVNGTKDGEALQSINYIGLIGILTKEIQELKERVTVLEKK